MRNKAKYELTESYWKEHARSITHMQQHKYTFSLLAEVSHGEAKIFASP